RRCNAGTPLTSDEERASKWLPATLNQRTRAIRRNISVEQFQRELIEKFAIDPIPTAGDASLAWGSRNLFSGAPAEIEPVFLRTTDDFHRHFQAKGGSSENVSLSAFMRAVAGMKTTDAARRALSVGVSSAGGYAVPAVVMPTVLGALAAASSMMQAGAAIVPLEGAGKEFSFAAVDTIPTAAWRLENGSVAESEPTFRNVVLTPRSLSFVVKVSRELLADGLNVELALRDAIAQAFAVEMDRAGLRGTGSAPEIRGLKNIVGVHSVTNGTNGAVLAGYANIFSASQLMLEANAQMPSAAIMSPRSLMKLGALVDTTNQPLQVPPMLQAVKQLQTSQIPNNLTVGSSSDCSEIYVGDFKQFVFGMREEVSIQVLEEAYAANGQIGFMCHARLDVAALYPKAFAIVTGVR
ncbi:phage major capsid protein, partial [Hydrogenophaga borbori]|uniref:phage major capsid protein n=1 Tax=Hydrogenophaga borbori TaxID=2294117 RepID=UPI00301E5875